MEVATEDDGEVRTMSYSTDLWYCYNYAIEPDWDYQDRRQPEVYETPEQKIRTAIIKLGEVVSHEVNSFSSALFKSPVI